MAESLHCRAGKESGSHLGKVPPSGEWCGNTKARRRGTKQEKGRDSMSVRIKLSYETEGELKKVLQLLKPVLKSWTRAPKQSGRFLRAYIILKD